MRTLIAFMVVGFLSGCVHSDPWTERDTKMQVATSIAIAADAWTTTRFQYNPNVYEDAPLARRFLGRHPKTSDTYQYFASVIVFNYLVARALPEEWRPVWQTWEFSVHGYAAYDNCRRYITEC